jgi:hypothetical protein
MAYDRYDTRNARDEGSRWSDDRDRGWDRDHSSGRGRDERGFWDRAGDEVASWFGDDDAERRRREDRSRDERDRGRGFGSGSNRSDYQAYGRDYDRGYGRDFDRDRRERERGWGDKFRTSDRGGFSDRDYNRNWRGETSRDRDWNDRNRERGYRPMTGDYGRASDYESEQFFAASGYGRGEPRLGEDRRDDDRSQSPYGRDETRRTSFAGSRDHDRDFDPHYRSWRDRHMSDLDRDYDDYRRENQSRFESDFGSWRERRMQKRGMLGQIREHMEVVGNDDKHVGTVDKVAGDRIILTKSDPESGGAHHSLSCSDIDRVDGDRVILDCSADEAHNRWRDESRSRALFEREDQGEMGPRSLNRSFEGTYR